MLVTSRAPVRIDFAGGWTDVNLFALGAGGAVVNATINHYVTGELEVYEEPEALSFPVALAGSQEGLRVAYRCDLPSGSGLGTSAALNVVWLSLIHSQITSEEDRARIAELAYQLEEMLGILGGKQDQYAAAFGGVNFITFNQKVHVERLAISPKFIEMLEKRLVLCYTGKPRLSGSIHAHVWGAFKKGVPQTVQALYGLRDCALRMREALLREDIVQFGSILSENWQHQKALDSSITNDQIERLFEVAEKAGAIGGKACGAGGGGCLLFCVEEGRAEEVAMALSQAGTRIIPFHFEWKGLEVMREE
ncbi:MAG TPA: hypothetical protein VKV29_04460 [Chthonomonas sp.]|uniref:GHMP family kinase ATP-binding protein n=1 Tax=Chthonomonas sp. TaxID=2282153 RepID=UPI002B4ABDAC|nr:hypothetical protein [Chthonomonas sp.]HLH79518.1 hypothetical protein [Chthonomonas sp.]